MTSMADKYANDHITIGKDGNAASWHMTISRLTNEMKKLNRDELATNGIYLKLREDFSKFELMILKKHDGGPYIYTPFFFTIEPCRDNKGNAYPMIPPIVKYISNTTSWFHPNIKPKGDVCISILRYSYIGGDGDRWNPTLTISSIAMILASLLDEFALKKEPGFGNLPDKDPKVQDYDMFAECVAMQSAIKHYEDLIANPEANPFRKELYMNSKDVLQSMVDRCKERTPKTVQVYSSTTPYNCTYDLILKKAIELHSKF